MSPRTDSDAQISEKFKEDLRQAIIHVNINSEQALLIDCSKITISKQYLFCNHSNGSHFWNLNPAKVVKTLTILISCSLHNLWCKNLKNFKKYLFCFHGNGSHFENLNPPKVRRTLTYQYHSVWNTFGAKIKQFSKIPIFLFPWQLWKNLSNRFQFFCRKLFDLV